MVVVSHIVRFRARLGEGKGSAYNPVEIKLSLSCEGAFGAGTLIGMGGMPGTRGRRRREDATRAPMRFEDRKGVFHWECSSIAAAVACASKGDRRRTREQEQ